MPEDYSDPPQPIAYVASPDPQGHAALLLVESLLHELVEASVLSLSSAIGIVDAAADVAAEIVADSEGAKDAVGKAMNLLASIAESLRLDLPDGEPTLIQ